MEALLNRVEGWIEHPWARVLAIAALSVVGAFLIRRFVTQVLLVLARRTETELDDEIIAALQRPLFVSVVLLGLHLLTLELGLPAPYAHFTVSVIKTLGVMVWAGALFRVTHTALEFVASRPSSEGMLQQRTLPIFEMGIKAAIIAGAVYFFFLAWSIDVTAWLASAGIVGIAVGFAAKDSLANLFSGLFIIADAPYRVGDFIVIDGELNGRPLRGEVTHIGMRSTRIVTRDDLEITIPNAVMGNSKIINETGGPTPMQRARIRVGVSYSSDPQKVAEVLMTCVEGVPHVASVPTPQVRFRDFSDSSLDFELLFWTDSPKMRGITESRLKFNVFRAFKRAGIEIPFPQRDLWIKSPPTKAGGDVSVDAGGASAGSSKEKPS